MDPPRNPTLLEIYSGYYHVDAVPFEPSFYPGWDSSCSLYKPLKTILSIFGWAGSASWRVPTEML